MGHRLSEMNGLLLQREPRVETQIFDLSNQMNSVLNASDVLRRERSLPRSSGERAQAGSSCVNSSSITIYLDSSTEADLSRAKATLSSQIDDAAYMSAQSMLSGPTSLYVTASNGIPSDNHCASSIRKKEQETMDLSVQATQGSDNATRDPEPKEEADVISPSS